MKTLGYDPNHNMFVMSLETGEQLPNKILVICNDFSKTYDIRKDKND